MVSKTRAAARRVAQGIGQAVAHRTLRAHGGGLAAANAPAFLCRAQ